ncbi:MAG: hypothetical protein ACMXX9_02315 [Candidatus Woesearchaeota archaeon]
MKIIKSIDSLVENEDVTSVNEKLSEVLNRRGEREKRFMFFKGFGNKHHHDHTESPYDNVPESLKKNSYGDGPVHTEKMSSEKYYKENKISGEYFRKNI